MLSAPQVAAARADTASPLADYVRARAAASNGSNRAASADFAAALAASPENALVATEALTHAVSAGDWPLALRAAATLDRRQSLLPDARFLLIAHAFRERDWAAAQRQIAAVEREQAFGFVVPILRAWMAVESGNGDPLALLGSKGPNGAGNPYAGEHRPLIVAATGRTDGLAGMLASASAGPRAQRLRMAAAGALAAQGRKQEALRLLDGNDLRHVRALIEADQPVPGSVTRAAHGLSELLLRLSLDLHGQGLSSVALGLARLATFAAPENSQAWMLSAELLARDERAGEGAALLRQVADNDPYRSAVIDQRIRLLAEAGEGAIALIEARAAAEREEASVADLVRLGHALMDQDRPAEAADAFAAALRKRNGAPGELPEWALWLFRGGAHDEADQWPEARAALERAYSLAPEEPLVLNYLGYAQLARRENLLEAERLVREAHRLAPDNAAITDSLGWALFLKGENEEAISLLEQAAAAEPADVEINEHLGDAYFSVGRRMEARFAWTAARVHADEEDDRRLSAKIETGLTPRLAAR